MCVRACVYVCLSVYVCQSTTLESVLSFHHVVTGGAVGGSGVLMSALGVLHVLLTAVFIVSEVLESSRFHLTADI